MQVKVTYRDRAGKIDSTTVHVDYCEYEQAYSATQLTLWGCGKYSRTIEGAVRQLAQDMATILTVTPLPEA